MKSKNDALKSVVKSIVNEQYVISDGDGYSEFVKNHNIPSVKLVTTTQRAQGYSNQQAINDILDNSFDAFAERNIVSPVIHVDFDLSKDRSDDNDFILIADNGGGFNDEEMLREALRLGSETKTNDENLLGCFGVGLKNAAISMGRLLVLITTLKDSGENWTAIMDLDKAEESHSWNFVQFRKSTVDEINILNEYKSDTIVLISKLDKIKAKNVSTFKQSIIKSSAEVFRYLLHDPKYKKHDGKAIMYVDDTPIEPIDVMCREISSTKLLNTADESNDFTSEYDGVPIKIKWYYIPVSGKDDNDTATAQSMRNQGIYVLRNNRQIKRATWLNVKVKHSDANHLRAELFFNSDDDGVMGTNSLKTDINLPDSLISKLNADITRYTQLTNNMYKDSLNAKGIVSDDAKLTDEDNVILNKINNNEMTPSLLNNEFKKELPKEKERETDDVEKKTRNGSKHNTHTRKKVDMEKYNGSKRDPFFQGIPAGHKKWLIRININHPFYGQYKSLNLNGKTMVFNLLYTYLIGVWDVFFIDTDFDQSQKELMIEKLCERWSDNVSTMIQAQTK